jgi:hypothetical protein
MKCWDESVKYWKALGLMRPANSEFHSRTGATLNNLAESARQRSDFRRCQDLATQAVYYQKLALRAKPVHKLAEEFLHQHYEVLSIASDELADYLSLAHCAEDRIQQLPDVASEWRLAAIAYTRCADIVRNDAQLTDDDKHQLADRFAQEAMDLLAKGLTRFDAANDRWEIAVAYFSIADGLCSMARFDDAQSTGHAALSLFENIRDTFDAKDRPQFDEIIGQAQRQLDAIRNAREASSAANHDADSHRGDAEQEERGT